MAGLTKRFYKGMAGKTILWDKVLADKGGLYNKKKGQYKALKSGFYM